MRTALASCCSLILLFVSLAGPAAAQGRGGPEIGFQVLAESDAFTPGAEARVALQFSLAETWHVNAHQPLDELLIPTVLTLDGAPAATIERIIYPEPHLFKFSFSDDQVAVYESGFRIGVVLKIAADATPGEITLTGALAYQACNDKMCDRPRSLQVTMPLKVVAAGTAVSPQHTDAINSIQWDAGLPPAPGETAPPVPSSGETTPPDAPAPPAAMPAAEPTPAAQSDWRALADEFKIANRTAFANTADFIAFIEDAEAGRGSATDTAFAGKSWWLVALLIVGGGLLLNLTPCVLPLIPINVAIIGAGARAGSRARGFALGAAYGLGIALSYGALGLLVVLGVSAAFGTINATVWFNVAMVVLFIALALAMFDVINIDFSRFQAKFGIRKNENGSFLVAFAMGAISALLAGACVAPAVISTIVYTQDRYSQGVTAALLLPFLLGVGMALPWPLAGAGLSLFPKPGRWMTRVKHVFGIFILGFAAFYAYEAYKLSTVEAATSGSVEGWETSLAAGLAQAKAENKPVLIDFWATWCKNCIVMDNTVLKEPEVLQRLENYIKIKYQAQFPDASPAKEVMEYYDVLGLPAYLILQPK